MTTQLRSVGLAIVALAAVSLSSAPFARADEVYTFVVKKQEAKAKTRWSLQDWLDTRDKMRLMDLWLALHGPSPYEFYVGGDYASMETTGTPRATGFRAYAAAYVTIFGLEAQRAFSPVGESTGLFHLRVFGFQAQGTNITLQAGIRSRDGAGAAASNARNALAGVSTTIYLARFMGIEGLYRRNFGSTSSMLGASTRLEGTAFLDFSFVRVYGTYFSVPTDSQSGFHIGTRLFF